MDTDTNYYLLAQHLTYLAFAMPVTWAVGRTLSKNGALFLVDTFRGREALAAAVNHLLVVGFYLVNFGWVVRGVKAGPQPYNAQQVLQNVAGDLGTVLLMLGALHFVNLYVFNSIRTRALERESRLPPVEPLERLVPHFSGASHERR